MTNKFNVLLCSVFALAISGCESVNNSSSVSDSDQVSSDVSSSLPTSVESQDTTNTSNTSSSTEDEEDDFNALGEDYSTCVPLSTLDETIVPSYWDDTYDDGSILDHYRGSSAYKNNVLQSSFNGNISTNDDVKYLFYGNDSARFVSVADGYAITVPTDTTLVGDFSASACRSKIYNEQTTITISTESSNPYGNGTTLSGWETYRDEWMVEYLEPDAAENAKGLQFLEANNLRYTRARKFEDTTILPGYSIIEYDIEILEARNIQKMFYNIAVVRPVNNYLNFNLIVMKSTVNMNTEFDAMLKSYEAFPGIGTANNSSLYNMESNPNPNWNEETKAYYELLKTQQRTDWGIYTGNLPSGTVGNTALNGIKEEQAAIQEAFDYQLDLLSSYQHISWAGSTSSKFPATGAARVCGGNGFNDLPVLQFTYQFTDNNNNLAADNFDNVFTPMFDIYRGRNYDDIDFYSYENIADSQLNTLAKAIKAYGKPVLFRLNNEMNTDWTSYCGMMTLLDPDIFNATWRILYHKFETLGVDNAIWIWNPIATSCPYSSWGEDMAYFPGEEYVQVLGLTDYTFNNENEAAYTSGQFRSRYTRLYNKNNNIWKNYPWIISEFACGAGGSMSGTLYRNQESQAKYVQDMFADFADRANHPYLQNIKGAVWFSTNDYSGEQITNALELDIPALPNTIAAFKEGLKNN